MNTSSQTNLTYAQAQVQAQTHIQALENSRYAPALEFMKYEKIFDDHNKELKNYFNNVVAQNYSTNVSNVILGVYTKCEASNKKLLSDINRLKGNERLERTVIFSLMTELLKRHNGKVRANIEIIRDAITADTEKQTCEQNNGMTNPI